MKRFYIAVALLVIAVAASSVCFYTFNRKIEALYTATEELLIETQQGKATAQKRKMDDLLALWEKSTVALHMLTMHHGMEEIELNILSLPDFWECEDREGFQEACIRAKEQLKNLQDSERVALKNIF